MAPERHRLRRSLNFAPRRHMYLLRLRISRISDDRAERSISMSRKSPWPVALLLVVPLGPAAAAPAPPEAFQPLASLSAAGSAVDWQPRLEDYDRLILTVVGPNGLVIHREFERGKDPSLGLTDKAGR